MSPEILPFVTTTTKMTGNIVQISLMIHKVFACTHSFDPRNNSVGLRTRSIIILFVDLEPQSQKIERLANVQYLRSFSQEILAFQFYCKVKDAWLCMLRSLIVSDRHKTRYGDKYPGSGLKPIGIQSSLCFCWLHFSYRRPTFSCEVEKQITVAQRT